MTNTTSASNIQDVRKYPAMGAVHTGVQQMRCGKCNKMLAKANGTGTLAAEIKCPRCGCMNES